MPCDSGMGGAGYDDEARRRVDELAQILCELMTFLNEKALIQGLPVRASQWFEQHKKQDQARILREMEEATRNEDKKAALLKLSAYERSLLGYK